MAQRTTPQPRPRGKTHKRFRYKPRYHDSAVRPFNWRSFPPESLGLCGHQVLERRDEGFHKVDPLEVRTPKIRFRVSGLGTSHGSGTKHKGTLFVRVPCRRLGTEHRSPKRRPRGLSCPKTTKRKERFRFGHPRWATVAQHLRRESSVKTQLFAVLTRTCALR